MQATKLSIKEKAGYGIGDIASNVIWQMVMFFLPIFYTDTFGLPAAVVGTLFIVVRLFDAINDPVMGTVADRTKTRWGKYRPYILWMAIPYGIGGVLMFMTPNFGLTGRIIYAYTTYIIMMVIYTAIMVPFNSLSGVMTSDSLERTSLNSYRFIGAFIGALFIQGLALYMVDTTGRDNQSIIHASIENKKLVINEQGPGNAKVTITATDKQNATVSQEFLVKVNRQGDNPPSVVNPPPDMTLIEGFETRKIDISNVFTDKDGDELTLSAESSAKSILTAWVTGETLIIRESGIGEVRITLIAVDTQGNSTNTHFVIKVTKKGNKPPVINKQLPDLELRTEFEERKFNISNAMGLYDEHRIDLSELFTDPDGDDLFYRSSSQNLSVASVTSYNSTLLIKLKSAGVSKISVIADDNHGGLARMEFLVSINPGENSKPMIQKNIDNITLEAGFSEHIIDISNLFTDPEGDELSYSYRVNNDVKGYIRTMIIFGAFSVFLFLITFSTSRERVKPIATESSKLKDDLKDLMKNGPWLILFFVSLITQIYVALRSAAIAYYFRYYVGDISLTGPYLVSGSITIILVLILTKWLTKKFGKRLLYVICMLVVAASLIGYQFLKPDQVIWIFVLQILQSVGSAPTMPLLWSMYADTSDYSEWKTGRKAMGLAYSASTFAQKAGIALGGAIALWMLALYGYQPHVEQTQTSLFSMRLMMGLAPTIGALVCAVLIGFYKLDTKTMNTIEEDLNKKRRD